MKLFTQGDVVERTGIIHHFRCQGGNERYDQGIKLIPRWYGQTPSFVRCE